MAKRGRKPAPRNLLKLRGSYREDRHGGGEAEFTGDVQPPAWLQGEGLEEWRRLAGDLEAAGLLTAGDVQSFAAYCNAVAEHAEALRHIRENGSVVTGPNGGELLSQWVPIMRKAREQIIKIGGEFGLTPSSRRNVPIDATRKPDALDALLAKVNG